MSAKDEQKSVFDSKDFAKTYRTAERITGQFAETLIVQSGLPTSSLDALAVLDLACGTGVVTATLIEGNTLSEAIKAKLDLTCADLADAMLDVAKERAKTNGWSVKTAKADAMDTGLPSSQFTHILFSFGWVLCCDSRRHSLSVLKAAQCLIIDADSIPNVAIGPTLMKDSLASIRECMRMLKPGGVLGITSWEYIPWIDEYRPAFDKHPEFPPYPRDWIDVITRFTDNAEKWISAEEIKSLLTAEGFETVDVQTAKRTTSYSVDEVVPMIAPTIGVLATNHWSEEQRETLTEPAVNAIEEHVREKYGDNPLVWDWSAYIATGRKPE